MCEPPGVSARIAVLSVVLPRRDYPMSIQDTWVTLSICDGRREVAMPWRSVRSWRNAYVLLPGCSTARR